MRDPTRCLLVMAVLFLTVRAAVSSDMGFARQLNIAPQGQNLSSLSLPFVYAPTTAEQLCADLVVPTGPRPWRRSGGGMSPPRSS